MNFLIRFCQQVSLEQYVIDNGIIDPLLQKGFLCGINGCLEHIFDAQQILSNAKEHQHHLSLSFIDLKNAYGSISHQYIFNILS